jgi:hypothetical protein
LNADFLQQFPRFKAVSLFEFTKREDDTIRDFTVLGKGQEFITPQFGLDAEAENGVTLAAFRADIMGERGELVAWGESQVPSNPEGTGSSSGKSAAIQSSISLFSLGLGLVLGL